MMERLSHPSLLLKVKIYQDRKNYFIMEEGGFLLKNEILGHLHKFSEVTAALIVRRLLEVIEYLHGNRLCHRAICSRNVVLDKPLNFYGETSMVTKLGDEGMIVSKDKGPKVTNINCKDLEYCSPQIVEHLVRNDGKKNCYFSQSDDIWALGCLVYELFTGRMPFGTPDGDN
jgi:serine/threonine protein kinase